MHLIKGTYLPKKNKFKLTKTKLRELELDWRKYNKDMKREGLHSLTYNTLDEYIKYRFGFNRGFEKEFKPYEPKQAYRRETKHYPSAPISTQTSDISLSKKEPQRYTGSLVKGISTMHKSNMVPIIDDVEAKEHANMRR